MAVIVCFGAGPKFKGGMSNYNTSLALALNKRPNLAVHIVSWTQQYPAIIPREFVDKSSKQDFLEGTNIPIKYILNYNNPLTWIETADYIASLHPDKFIFQWSIALQGLPIHYVVQRLKKKCPSCEIIFDLHFVKQKEQSKIDLFFTKFGIRQADSYIVHAYKTLEELNDLYPKKKFHVSLDGESSHIAGEQTVMKLFHPIYNLYQPDPNFDIAKFKKDNHIKKHVILFFGFIRKYKGLHQTIDAFRLVVEKRNDVTLLICGESFWNTLDSNNWMTKVKKTVFRFLKSILLGDTEDESQYNPLALIEEYHLQDSVVVFNQYIPNEDVHKYFQVADCAVLYYLTATPSGIESLSYNFDLPLLATRVGHFPETIQDGINGYLVRDNTIPEMATTMLRFLDHPLDPKNVASFKQNMSWDAYAEAIDKERD